MNKTDVVKIIDENCQEAHKLLWAKMGDKELTLTKKVFVIVGISEGYITKVRLCEEDGAMECYFEDNEDFDSGWTDFCDISYGYENNVYLALDEELNNNSLKKG
jgi:hypothetical protein